MNNDLLQKIQSQLNTGRLTANLTPLFCETLRWGSAKGMAPRELKVGAPVNMMPTAYPVAQLSGLPVFRVDWPEERLPGITARRAVQRALKPIYAEHLLCYVTRDQQQAAFTWARTRADGKTEIRTLPYEVGTPARTTIERLGELAFSLDELATGEPSITAVTDKLNRAFDVEAVTKQFFQDYQKVFGELQGYLLRSRNDSVWAHDYALQLLNRLMFLYFIQRKGWLDNDPNFLRRFWQSYKKSEHLPERFFKDWLCVLFFEAFNNTFHGGHRHFPEEIKRALQLAPFLNGGLFRKNALDIVVDLNLPDEFFATLFDRYNGSSPGFLERYNFTVAESTPLDIEVAVDPEMIGKVYESLVNITSEGITEEDRRGSAGIFYTPRVEIDLMCRLALVDALANRLGHEHKWLLYDAVFASEPEEKDIADHSLNDRNLWPALYRELGRLTICDPACGSGSFLVGMLLVLDDLRARANRQLGKEETPYERRRRIIGEQLYGVDVMDWAVHVAELRLWLQLVVETELEPAELKFRPLLPNLSFKVRCGDSLVQEIGGINFGLHRAHLDIPAPLRGRITQLKGKKLRFYQGEPALREADLKAEELALFREILGDKRIILQREIARLTRQIGQAPDQADLPRMERPTVASSRHEIQRRIQRDEKQAELRRIEEALQALRRVQDIPFVWDIAFVEIFEGDAGGFDIVIGNPPYVRQEMIAPPTRNPNNYGGENSDRWKEEKRTYKAKLQESVAAAWPRFFRYKPGSLGFRKADGKSDLYIYFYLHGLSLLNPHGSFCFITSNSWLDVGYGADLQEFLLKHSHIKLILDNEKKRSFAQADVNTIIALLAPPDERRDFGLDKIARFVMFKAPFEEVMRAETFKTIETVGARCNVPLHNQQQEPHAISLQQRRAEPTYRVTARLQRELLEEGLEHDEDEEEPAAARKRSGPLIKVARYIGNKWGGKYLRAPDIFFTILEKGKGKLVRLGDIAEVRRGFTTGANEFFYLDEERIHQWGIEREFLKPVIKSPRECRRIVIKPEDLKYKIFMCQKDKSELKGTAALEYIQWGESQKFHLRPSCRGRKRWWDVGVRSRSSIVWVKSINDVHRQALIPFDAFVDQRLYEITHEMAYELNLNLNATITILMKEMIGRVNLGEGVLDTAVYEAARVYVLEPKYLGRCSRQLLDSIYSRISRRPILPILTEVRQPDRRALDDVVFDVLGLTAGEREAVYEAVVELVRARLEKAKSV